MEHLVSERRDEGKYSQARRNWGHPELVKFLERFAARHRGALSELAARVALDYFTIDCAETKQGELLVFEADNTSIVHNMDRPEIFPYKPPQMRMIFDAFAAMLVRHAGKRLADA